MSEWAASLQAAQDAACRAGSPKAASAQVTDADSAGCESAQDSSSDSFTYGSYWHRGVPNFLQFGTFQTNRGVHNLRELASRLIARGQNHLLQLKSRHGYVNNTPMWMQVLTEVLDVNLMLKRLQRFLRSKPVGIVNFINSCGENAILCHASLMTNRYWSKNIAINKRKHTLAGLFEIQIKRATK